MPDADQLYEDPPESAAYTVQATQGRIPEGLRGTFLRAGPGIQRVGSRRLHLLDGYGFIAGLSFDRGQAYFRARHVRTPAFERERAAGKQLMRRVFTNKPGRWSNMGDLKVAEGANHDVLVWGGKVVATDAPGHRSLDPHTLETQGPAPTQSLLENGLATLCQMPRPDVANGRLVAFAVTPGLGADQITFSEMDRSWSLVSQRTYRLDGKGVVLHDLAFTPQRYLALELGRLRLATALWGKGSIFGAVGPARDDVLHAYLFPRQAEGPVRRVALPPRSQAFHFFNAFDDGRDLVFDIVLYPRRVDFDVLNPPGSPRPLEAMVGVQPEPVRCRLKPGEDTLELTRYPGTVGEAPCINPAFHGQRHRFGYFAARTERGDEDTESVYFYFHGVGALDFETGQAVQWNAGPRCFVSPPAFVPRPGAQGEQEGWLLAWVLDTANERSSVVVLDAQHVEDGPVAVLPLQHALPAVSHVEFSNEAVFAGM